jgi:UDP-N-acetylmuramoylalanine--D-glutamate ligase
MGMPGATEQPMTSSRTIVVGLGLTGLSCVRYLARHGVEVAVVDSREQPPGLDTLQREYPDVPVFLGPFDASLLASAGELVVSPGVPVSTPAIVDAAARGVSVVGDIELFAREVETPVVAITGSNGKSTVTTLVGEMARSCGVRVAVGGNLGRPALDLIDEAPELFVLELSSFQLETTRSLCAAVATVLNVSVDHMDRYPSFEHYAAAKARIFEHAGVGVFNADDITVMAMPGADDRWFFSLGPAGHDKMFGVTEIDGRPWLCRGRQALIDVEALCMPGLHNRANALAALAIGTALGFDAATMGEVLRRFRGLPHRTEFVTEHEGVCWYNDSKGTNVGATVAAIRGLCVGQSGRVVLIAGGDAKGADFEPLRAVLEDCVRAVVLIGRDAGRIAAIVPTRIEQRTAASIEAAVDEAAALAEPGDRVLLSPACASFDMFDSYIQRGDQFKQVVRRRVA